MNQQQEAAHEIADGLEQLGHDLRASFNRSVRQMAPVTFSGPLAALFDRRLQAHLTELNTILAGMGVTTDDLRILGRQDGELALRRRSTGYVKNPGKPGRHVEKQPEEKDDDRPAGNTAALPAQYRKLMPLVERAADRHHVSPALLLALMDHDWRDPEANIDYGASVIAANLKHYDGDVDRAAAAYNAGPGAVDRALAGGRGADSVTTGGDYGSDVARRYAYFRKLLAR